MTYVLLPLEEVERRLGKKKTSIYSDPDLPKPIKIGGKNRWIESELNTYIEARIRERDGVPEGDAVGVEAK